MDLLEYQAKALFREVGIPILPSQQIDDPRDLKQLQLPYPIVLKSQVHAGGRGRAGGIRFVENTIDAIAAARTIFNLPIVGEYPQVLLAEARYDAEQECFLAIVFDYLLGCPILLGSSQGGIHVEAVLDQMQKIVLKSEFSPFYARKLAVAMGLKGKAIESVSEIIVKMYRLFTAKDLNSIEINPLGINAAGEVMALDGKIAIDDRALGRQYDVLGLLDKLNETEDNGATEPQPQDLSPSVSLPLAYPLDCENSNGTIGILTNSAGLGMLTWDLLARAKGKPACCWVIAAESDGLLLDDADVLQSFAYALAQLQATPGIDRITINCLSSAEMSTSIAKAIAELIKPPLELLQLIDSEDRAERPTAVTSRSQRSARAASQKTAKSRSSAANPPEIKYIVRLVAVNWDDIPAVPHSNLYWTADLDQAIQQTIASEG
jgi:succinyl-CoA synthetase beta subunit